MDSVLSASNDRRDAATLDAFVYFYDLDDIRHVGAEWPEEIGVAVCLDAVGTCEFVIYHMEEQGGILLRIGRILGRETGEYATSPLIDGYPERRLKFSEESALLRALKEDGDLFERALDYLVNYRFARDEGLDPEAVCADVNAQSAGERSADARQSVRRIFPVAPRRETPPPVPAADPAPPRVAQFEASLAPIRGHVRLLAEGAEGDPVLIDAIDWQPALASFRIPASALGQADPTRRPVDIPASLLPLSVMSYGRAWVTWTETGMTVTPARPVAPPAPRAPRPRCASQAREALARRLRVPILASVSLVATGFLSAMVAHAVTDDGSRSLWSGVAPSLAVFQTP